VFTAAAPPSGSGSDDSTPAGLNCEVLQELLLTRFSGKAPACTDIQVSE
jgi:hypothetical protein